MNSRSYLTIAHEQLVRSPVTIGVGLIALAIGCVPAAQNLLQFDRMRILAGELWRLASGHLTHWNSEHLQWDLLMFVVLGGLCERRNPRQMWLCVAGTAVGVSALVFCLFPGIGFYRGLSGIDTALFALLSIDLLRDARSQKNVTLAVAVSTLFVGLVVKTGYEVLTGHAFFVDQHLAGFDVLIWDHIASAMLGATIAIGFSAMGRLQPQKELQTCLQPHFVGETHA